MAFIDDIKRFWQAGNLLQHIIIINVAVFLVFKVLAVGAALFAADLSPVLSFTSLPSTLSALLHKPWTLITYMFVHISLWEILFNMLWLYWLGRIFLEFFTPKQLGGLYFLGGIGGAALFILAYTALPALSGQQVALMGSSAAILAIVVGTAIYAPDYRINLLLFGQISLKWVALITVFIDFLGLESGNTGGHLSHLGGILVGLWFGLAIRNGHDITRWLNAAIDWVVNLFSGKQWHMEKRNAGTQRHNPHRQNGGNARQHKPQPPTESEIDAILDKLKQNGYAALSDEEKATLFRASGKK